MESLHNGNSKRRNSMKIPRFQGGKQNILKSIHHPHLATLITLGMVGLLGALSLAWLMGEKSINQFFEQIHFAQENIPLWLQVPLTVNNSQALILSLILVSIVMSIIKVSPQPRPWSKLLVISILLLLMGRYLLWRSFSTLNLINPLNGIFSIGLLGVEIFLIVSSFIQLFLLLGMTNRSRQASQGEITVLQGDFTPSVDILIPTYNEPLFILKRTILGCQNLNYKHKKIYLLDDSQRPEVKTLTQQLGCEYISRPYNHHAKAGNLNHSLEKTTGEFIVVFDADFIPTENFLTRTLGFFQDSQLGLVQTPQTFYNSDPVSYNLGIDGLIPPEEEVFYRQIEPLKDGAGSVVCSGTSFVVRRSALEQIGGFETASLSEDYFTGIRLAAAGYKLIYLNEKLSAGLAAENIVDHILQRLRWAQGTLQAFFISANPLTIPGLNPLQRLAHLDSLISWFTCFTRILLLFMPLAYAFLDILPWQATPTEFLYFYVPYYGTQITAFSWLNLRSRSAFFSEIYSVFSCFPLAMTVIQTMLNPFGKSFKVTRKGIQRHRFQIRWKLATPLILLFIATGMSLWQNICQCLIVNNPEVTEIAITKGLSLGWIWSAYNLVILGISLLILIDVPQPNLYQWFNLKRDVVLHFSEKKIWGKTTQISEVGIEIQINQNSLELFPGDIMHLELFEEKLKFQGEITKITPQDQFLKICLQFTSLNLEQQRQLIKLIFCRPGQWQQSKAPGELQSLLLLFKALFFPRIVFNRQPEPKAITITQ